MTHTMSHGTRTPGVQRASHHANMFYVQYSGVNLLISSARLTLSTHPDGLPGPGPSQLPPVHALLDTLGTPGRGGPPRCRPSLLSPGGGGGGRPLVVAGPGRGYQPHPVLGRGRPGREQPAAAIEAIVAVVAVVPIFGLSTGKTCRKHAGS